MPKKNFRVKKKMKNLKIYEEFYFHISSPKTIIWFNNWEY